MKAGRPVPHVGLQRLVALAGTLVPLPVLGHWLGNHWLTPLLVLVALPLADLLVGRDRSNPTPEQIAASQRDRWLYLPLRAWLPVQCALIAWGAWEFSQPRTGAWQGLGLLLSIGLVSGGQGITIAHELGHRRSRVDRWLAQALLMTVGYGHFHIEHNRGHHARVATQDDPATARRGESFYRFWWRALPGAWRSAWALETARLERQELPRWSAHNMMLWYAAVPLALLLAFALLLGPLGAAFFAGQALVAVSLLEAVNYIEHYGLQRQRGSDGRLEPVTLHHSWNAAERVSNAWLFNLQRHADHHAHPALPYVALRHHDDSPQLPTGYTGMLWLALLPPLWFALMNRRIDALAASGLRPAA